MNRVGIMQGRLSPRSLDRLQAFPWRTWAAEFSRARAVGFDCIEWLFDAEGSAGNPVCTTSGHREICRLVEEHHVEVHSVCAHYFAQRGIRERESGGGRGDAVLAALVQGAAEAGAERVIIPLLEAASLRNRVGSAEAFDFLRACQPAAEDSRVRLALETDLSGPDCAWLIERLDPDGIGVCYDTGNATALGYDIVADVQPLLPWLVEVHIKDRVRAGASVPLGQGDTPFVPFFQMLAKVGYEGPFILETPTGDDWDGSAIRHLRFVRDLLAVAYKGDHTG